MVTLKYKGKMDYTKITIKPNGTVKITMTEKHRIYEDDIMEYSERVSDLIRNKLISNLKIRVKVVDGKVVRVKSNLPKYKFNGSAISTMEYK